MVQWFVRARAESHGAREAGVEGIEARIARVFQEPIGDSRIVHVVHHGAVGQHHELVVRSICPGQVPVRVKSEGGLVVRVRGRVPDHVIRDVEVVRVVFNDEPGVD